MRYNVQRTCICEQSNTGTIPGYKVIILLWIKIMTTKEQQGLLAIRLRRICDYKIRACPKNVLI